MSARIIAQFDAGRCCTGDPAWSPADTIPMFRVYICKYPALVRCTARTRNARPYMTISNATSDLLQKNPMQHKNQRAGMEARPYPIYRRLCVKDIYCIMIYSMSFIAMMIALITPIPAQNPKGILNFLGVDFALFFEKLEKCWVLGFGL